MKSLNIAFENIALDDCNSHQVKIEYMGGIQRGRLQGRTHTVTVAYSSLSKKMQSIHRLGGKIVNVSISRFQVASAEVDAKHSDAEREIAPTPEKVSEIAQTHGQPLELEVALETLDRVDRDESISPETAVIITEDIVETIPEIIVEPEIIAEPEVIAEEPEVITEPEIIAEPEIILEIASEKIDVISEKTAAVEDVTAVTPEKSKPSPSIASKPKKPRTSTKTSHGFSKRDTKTQTEELQTSHQEELKPEQLPEPVSEIIVEQVEQVAKSVELESLPILEVISEEPEFVEPVAEVVVEETSEAIAEIEKVIPEASLKVKSSSPKKSAAKPKKSKAAKIADKILQVAEETVVEANIDLPTPEIAEVIPEPTSETNLTEPIISEPVILEPIISELVTEESAASIPESSSIPKSLAKSKKSKAANKSGHGFNKSKGDR